MNGGNIPGYYFDEEKQKYFKIQANHLVPPGAKYSKGIVQQENRKSKRRKLEDREIVVRHQQTVKRSPVLHDAIIGGVGIRREHGICSTSQHLHQSDPAVISQWRPTRVKVKFDRAEPQSWDLGCTNYSSSTQTMVIAGRHALTGTHVLHACQWSLDNSSVFLVPSWSAIEAFQSGISSISSVVHNDTLRVVACGAGVDARYAGVFSPRLGFSEQVDPSGILFTVGRKGSELLASSIHQTTGIAAIVGTDEVFVLDFNAQTANSLPSADDDEYGPNIDWSSSNTVAYYSNTSRYGKRHVMLWDIRTRDGTSARFNLRRRITGVLNPSDANSGGSHQLLVSTNHRINLFDTRMAHSDVKNDMPVLSFPHVHQGQKLEFMTNKRGLIAAVDRDNVVQVYSTRSGHRMGPLTTPDWKLEQSESRMVRQLQWYEDARDGSTLQACFGNGIVRWIWGGMGDEER